MIVKDHINIMGFAGNNPLQGPNDSRFGPRFPAMNKAYDPELIKLGKEIANDMKIGKEIHSGVYTCLGGPNYETVAELRMWKMLGVDAVGMSTVILTEETKSRINKIKILTGSRSSNSSPFWYESFRIFVNNKCLRDGIRNWWWRWVEWMEIYVIFDLKSSKLFFKQQIFVALFSANHEEVMAIGNKKTKMLSDFVAKFIEKSHGKHWTRLLLVLFGL